MAFKTPIFAVALIVGVSPASAIQAAGPTIIAPVAGPDAKYCMRIEAVTGTRLEKVRCWTRQQWADQDVDVDEEWAEEGVAVLSDGARLPVES